MSIDRQFTIISKLITTPMSYEELQDFMQLQYEITEKDLTSSLRTFQRDIKQIAARFNVVIEYNSTSGKYEISDDGLSDLAQRLIEVYEILTTLNLPHISARYMLVEKRKPLGTQNLSKLLQGIKDRRGVSFQYEKFTSEEQQKRMVNPLAVKESQNRWYLLAEDEVDGNIKSFGLDRMEKLELTGRKFEPVDYKPEEEYLHAFGIISGVESQPEKIVLSFVPREGKYVHSLPLHHSQKEILRNEKEWRYEYYILPTHDFIMEVLSYGADVKVLEPESFKNKVLQKLKDAVARY